jgi:hypothetical protein
MMANQETKKQKIERIAKSLLKLQNFNEAEISLIWATNTLDQIIHVNDKKEISEREFLLKVAHRIYNERKLNTPLIKEKMNSAFMEGYKKAVDEMKTFIDELE